MNKKNLLMITVALVLAGVYAVFFTDWFRPKTIHISYTSRPARFAARLGQKSHSPAVPVAFGFGLKYKFTEIKVVPLAALQTNSLAQPLWHLVSDSGSEPINHFLYGQKIKGMDPVVEGARPQPLQPGVTYCLLVRAGSVNGQHDFQIGAVPAITATNR